MSRYKCNVIAQKIDFETCSCFLKTVCNVNKLSEYILMKIFEASMTLGENYQQIGKQI